MPFVSLRWLNSLNLKVLLAFVAGAVLSVVLIVLAAVLIVSSQGDILSGKAVAERTEDLARKLRFDSAGLPAGFDDPIEGAFDDIDDSWQQESLKSETAYRVLDASGNVVLSSAAGEAFWPESGIASRLERGRFEFEQAGVAMRGATEPVEHHGKTWFVQFAASTRFLHLIYRDFALPFAGVGIVLFSLVLLFVFGVGGYVTLRFTLKPLREISASAAAISPQSLHARLQTSMAPIEIEPLVESFNRALERLEYGYRVQQEFLATAAHELKTPLTLIRSQIELGVDEGSREVLLQDVSRMGRQVQQLLHLAEASEPQNYEFASVDTESLVFEVMNYLERLANQQGVRMQAAVAPGLTLARADRGALFTLLKNLLENAIQHSRAGGVVQLRADSNLISVQDEGPGVLPEDFPKLFTRFWRSADRRDLGAGLGLSICREIATAHGWDLQARRGEPGMVFDLKINSFGITNQRTGVAKDKECAWRDSNSRPPGS
jgi:signal transduction histidine kinase